MALGEIVRMWGAVEYVQELRFFQNMYQAARDFHKAEFEHWTTDRVSVTVHDLTKHISLAFSSKRLVFEAANPENIQAVSDHVRTLIRRALNNLRINHITRRGYKLVVYLDLNLSFEEITARLRPLSIGKQPDLVNLTSDKILDLALRYDYEWEGNTAQLRVGPMNKEQGMQMLGDTGRIRLLFNNPMKDPAFSSFCAKVPDKFLYFDLDVFSSAEVPADAWTVFQKEAYSHVQSVFLGLAAMIKGPPSV